MDSGHGVRASTTSIAESRYSHDEFSDHDNIAPSDDLGRTQSTFGLGEDISAASFNAQQQQHDDRSLQAEDSLAESLPDDSQDDPLARRARLAQPILQEQGQTPRLTPPAAAQSPVPQGILSRSSSQHSLSSRRTRGSTELPAAAAAAASLSPPLATSQQQPQLDDLLPPRPRTASPIKRLSSSSRRHGQFSKSSSGLGLGARAAGDDMADGQQEHSPAAATAAAGQQQVSGHAMRQSSDRQENRLPQQRLAEQQQAQQLRQHKQPRHEQQQSPTPSKRQQAAGPDFEGDLSEWGKTNLENFYDDDDDHSIASSHMTMSSGIGPRDARPRLRDFEPEAARQSLAYNAGLYSRAQALRRDGTAPTALGIADDLPTRMAYQQLHVLAGMAGKVQDAILHNKRIFEQRMVLEDRFLRRRIFEAWRTRRFGSVAKQLRAGKAGARILRGLLSRTFFAWKNELHLVDKNLAMKRKVAATIARGLMKRAFLAWQRLADERVWKNQLVMREREAALLEAKIRGYEKRPIQVLKKRKLRSIIQAWCGYAAHRREKRAKIARAGRCLVHKLLEKAWTQWVDATEQGARKRVLSHKVAAHVQRLETARAWTAWLEALDAKHEKAAKLLQANQHQRHYVTRRAWSCWVTRTTKRRGRRKIEKRWMQPMKAKALTGWLNFIAKDKRNRLVLARVEAKRRNGMVANAFSTWAAAVDDSKVEARVSTKEGMEELLSRLQAENERLRRDNERFVRLIDSGEWGRGRVAEMVAAGEVMQTERDALLKLIGSLRREYEAVQMAKNQQEEELRHLKEKMTVGGAARNRLLVKGGSSFNALVRAMKQDLVENGTAAKDPALLYEIDKLSMDRVQVFPDGELNVQAVNTSGSSAGFARPVSRGGGRPGGPGSPMHRGLSDSPAGSPKQSAKAAGAAALGSAGYLRVSSSLSPARAAAAAVGGGGDKLHTTMRFEAAGAGPTQKVFQALSSLSPAQVEQLEAAAQQQQLMPSVAGSAAAAGVKGSPLGVSRRR